MPITVRILVPVFDYLNPDLPPNLARVTMRVVDATAATLQGYGHLVDDPAKCRIEIVRWPAQGSRPVDADTGDQGGTTEGVFVSEWRGDILYGRNKAVGGHDILAYAQTLPTGVEAATPEPAGENATPSSPIGGPASNLWAGILTALGSTLGILLGALVFIVVLLAIGAVVVTILRKRR